MSRWPLFRRGEGVCRFVVGKHSTTLQFIELWLRNLYISFLRGGPSVQAIYCSMLTIILACSLPVTCRGSLYFFLIFTCLYIYFFFTYIFFLFTRWLLWASDILSYIDNDSRMFLATDMSGIFIFLFIFTSLYFFLRGGPSVQAIYCSMLTTILACFLFLLACSLTVTCRGS